MHKPLFLLGFFFFTLTAPSFAMKRALEVDYSTYNTVLNIDEQIDEIKRQIKLNNWKTLWKIQNKGSALFLGAIALGKLDVVKYLITGKSEFSISDILAPTKDGPAALNVAAKFGQVEVAEFLFSLSHEVVQEIIKPDQNGFTALHTCARFGQSKFARFLLASSPEIVKEIIKPYQNGVTALHTAAQFGQIKVARVLMSSSPAIVQEIVKPNQIGCTALHPAARNNKLDFAGFLLGYRPEFSTIESERIFFNLNNQPITLKDFLVPFEPALAIGTFNIKKLRELIADQKLSWDEKNSSLLKNILLNKTKNERDSANKILEILAAAFPLGHEAIEIIKEYLIGYNLKNIIIQHCKDTLLSQQSGKEFEYAHDGLKFLTEKYDDNSYVYNFEDFAMPGTRIHAKSYEEFLELLDKEKLENKNL